MGGHCHKNRPPHADASVDADPNSDPNPKYTYESLLSTASRGDNRA